MGTTRRLRFLPRSLSERYTALRRDLGMLWNGLAGRPPPPLVPRPPRSWAPPAAMPSVAEPPREYLPAHPPQPAASSASTSQPLVVWLQGKPHEVEVPPGATLLEAGLAAGLPMPCSCTIGGCGTCRVVLRQGEVHMQEPHCLTPQERAQGYVLACVSRPLSPVEVLVPDEGALS